jgi:hypothetical protein
MSEVLWSLPRRGLATVAGVAISATKNDEGQRLMLTDGSGLLDVWCPADMPAIWLADDHPACQLTVDLGAPAPPVEVGGSPAGAWQRVDASPPHGVVTDMRVRMFR